MKSGWETFYRRYKEQILYFGFGVGTTIVDFSITYLLYALSVNVHVSDVIAWICSVTFSFTVNRIWVFETEKKRFLGIMKEYSFYTSGRILTLLMQEGFVFLFVDILCWNPYLVKIPVAVLVVILNYFFSKWIVFPQKAQKNRR